VTFILLREIFSALPCAACILRRTWARSRNARAYRSRIWRERRTCRVIVIPGPPTFTPILRRIDHSEKTSRSKSRAIKSHLVSITPVSSNVHNSRVVDCRYWTRREYYAGRINLAASENRERCDARVSKVAAAPRKFFACFLSMRSGKRSSNLVQGISYRTHYCSIIPRIYRNFASGELRKGEGNTRENLNSAWYAASRNGRYRIIQTVWLKLALIFNA